MDKLLEAIGASLAGMPPAWAASVILGLAVMGLIYAWRKAGEEAKREKSKAAEERAGAHGASLARVEERQLEIMETLTEVNSGVRVLLDRRR